MAKLRADITYKRRKQESLLLKSTMTNIELEQHTNLDNLNNLDNQNKETDSHNRNELDQIVIEEESDSDEDIEEDINIEEQFQNQIDQCLEIEDDDNDFDIDDIDVESTEHPAQNKNAKWKLDTIFKDDLYCPFNK